MVSLYWDVLDQAVLDGQLTVVDLLILHNFIKLANIQTDSFAHLTKKTLP